MALSTLVDRSHLGRRVTLTGNSTDRYNGVVRWVQVDLDSLAAYTTGYVYTAAQVRALFGMGRIDAVLIPSHDMDGTPVAVVETLEFDLTGSPDSVTMTVKGAIATDTFTGNQWLVLFGAT